MAAKSDYYDILEISKGASADEIKKAYKKQAIEWHPDKHQDNKDAAEKRFKEINEAYQILSDTQKRQAYDQYGHQAFAPGGGFPGGGAPGAGGFGGQSPFGGGGGTWRVHTSGGGQQAGFDFGDPFEIFSQFFGGGSPFGARSARIPRYSITIDFMEAVNGIEKEVSIEGKKKKIKIPAGVTEGSRIRFDDFMLSVDIKPHDVFERDGADVFVKLAIPYSLAVLGGQINVPTVEGDVKIKIKKGTASGTMIRLRGKGVPRLRGRGKGDQYVRIQVAVPDKLSRSQKKIIEEMKREGL